MILATSREQIWNAFFAVLETISAITTCTRRLKHWESVEGSECPAAYLALAGETRIPSHGKPPKIVLEGEIWLYVRTEEQEAAVAVNPILDAIDKALEPPPGVERFTLGGLVHHCWIEGQTQIFEGNLGDTAVAIIPVKLLVT